MANVHTNTANIGGEYSGTVAIGGPVLLGKNLASEGTTTPVVVMGSSNSVSQDSNFSIVGGEYARASSSLSFVWNGSRFPDGDSAQTPYSTSSPYLGANRSGTFSINPVDNLDGVFIGTKSLHAHMDELSGNVVESFALTSGSHSSPSDNNVVHKDAQESISGPKTFESSLSIGSTDSNRVVIENSSIHIDSDGNGGLLFHFDGDSTITASLKETESGKISVGAKLGVTGDSTFGSESNTFNGITLSNGKNASFENGNVYVATPPSKNNSSLAASTEYVDNAISNIQEGAIFGSDGVYTGKNTFNNKTVFGGETVFSNTVSLLPGGNLYVPDQPGTDSSSLAANTGFVQNIAASISKNIRGDKVSIGSGTVPIYLNGTSASNASLVQSTSTVGSETSFIYMNGGSLVGSSASLGDLNTPVYLNGGNITECNTMVNTGLSQEVTGKKVFSSSLNMFKSSLKVYVPSQKGTSGVQGACVDFVYTDNTGATYNEANMRVGVVGTSVDSANYTQSYISAYSNRNNTTTNTSIGVKISKDGKEKYAYAPTPTNSLGNISNIPSTDSVVVPTIGWSNTYYARKDGATFSGSLNANSGLKVKSQDRSYGIEMFNQDESRGSYIGLNGSGELEILPCKIGEYNSPKSTVSSIRFGYASIGSSIQPVFVDGGRLSSITATVGSSLRPVYLSSGKIVESSDVVHIDYDESINGKKDFSSLLVGTNPLVYPSSDFVKGTSVTGSSSIRFGIGFSDKNKTFNDDSKLLGKVVHSIDANGSSLSLVAYKNETDSLTNSQIGIFVPSTGTSTYAFAPTPPDSTSTSENRIATTGWCNKYFSRNGGTVGSPYTPIYLNNGVFTQCNTGRIVGHVTLQETSRSSVNLSAFILPSLNCSSLYFVVAKIATGEHSSIYASIWCGDSVVYSKKFSDADYDSIKIEFNPSIKKYGFYLNNAICNVTLLAY